MRVLRGLCGVVVAGLIAAMGSAAQEKAEPKPNDKAVPGGFRIFLVIDGRFEKDNDRNRVGKLHDPVTEHGLFAVLAVFSRNIPAAKDDPVVKLIERQEELAKKYENKKLGAFAAFLAARKNFEDDDDRKKYEAEIANISRNFKFVQTGYAEQQSAQNAAWQLDAKNEDGTFKNHVTVVIYNRLKIVARWDFPAGQALTDADLDKITAAVDVLMGRKPSEPKKPETKKDELKTEEPKKEAEKK